MDIDNQLKFAGFTTQLQQYRRSSGNELCRQRPHYHKCNVARGFRALTWPERASNGAHEGTNRYELGANDLKSETSLQIDGGFELNSEHVSLETSLFYNHIKDFIFYEKGIEQCLGERFHPNRRSKQAMN